jgi:hypothetical protein
MAHRLAMACVPMLAIGENQLESLLYVLLICKIISTDAKLISDLSFDCGGAQNFRLRQTTFLFSLSTNIIPKIWDFLKL